MLPFILFRVTIRRTEKFEIIENNNKNLAQQQREGGESEREREVFCAPREHIVHIKMSLLGCGHSTAQRVDDRSLLYMTA